MKDLLHTPPYSLALEPGTGRDTLWILAHTPSFQLFSNVISFTPLSHLTGGEAKPLIPLLRCQDFNEEAERPESDSTRHPQAGGVRSEPQTLAPTAGAGSEPPFLVLLPSGEGQSCPRGGAFVPVSLPSALPLPKRALQQLSP